MVKLSVIMPVYNASNYLENSICSVLKQDIDDFELICIDDGSIDDSLNIIKQFSQKYDFINIIQQENAGSGSARNKGIKAASGKYIAFLDADDIFLDNSSLKKMYKTAIKTNADMVCANLKRINRDMSIDENYDYENTNFKYFTNEQSISPEEYGIPWAFYKNIYRKSFLESNNITFPNLSRGQDPIFLAKILTKIKKIQVFPIDLYGYNHSASGGVNIKVNDYNKKKDYINHFIQTFKILDKKGFEKSLGLYKKEFIDYINFRQNINDEEIRKIIQELPELDEFFKKDDYGYLILDLIKNPIEKEDNEYTIIKECLFEESMLENTFINPDRLQSFARISQNSAKDLAHLKSSFNQLKNIEDYTFENKRTISGNIGKLQKEIKHYINNNNAILTSNSWKLTNYLRVLKNKF